MPRPNQSIYDIISDAVSQAMRTIVPAVQRQIDETIAKGLSRKGGAAGARGARRRARARRQELTRWVADKRARRVPNFVIEMTGGLDTKKRILARYGEGAAFEKGKPLPPLSAAAHRSAHAREGVAARVVKARPPVVRKTAVP